MVLLAPLYVALSWRLVHAIVMACGERGIRVVSVVKFKVSRYCLKFSKYSWTSFHLYNALKCFSVQTGTPAIRQCGWLLAFKGEGPWIKPHIYSKPWKLLCVTTASSWQPVWCRTTTCQTTWWATCKVYCLFTSITQHIWHSLVLCLLFKGDSQTYSKGHLYSGALHRKIGAWTYVKFDLNQTEFWKDKGMETDNKYKW